uniref:Uncharacterized protein n=1 Tax=Arundo donax TaxID=35708 RepID=A0A0A9C3A9_ARUDO
MGVVFPPTGRVFLDLLKQFL